MESLVKSIITSALLTAVILPFRVLSTDTTNNNYALPFRGKLPVSGEMEPYEVLQLRLERIADQAKLYNMPMNLEKKVSQQLKREPAVERITSQCTPFHATPLCDDMSRYYRTFDGTCNNQNHPKLGGAYTRTEALLPPFYEGVYRLRKSVDGSELPNPRDLTLGMLQDEDHPSEYLSFFFVLFGQLVAHDITNTPIIQIDGKRPDCCGEKRNDTQVCAPVLLRPNDTFFDRFNKTCLDFVRSAPYASCDFSKRVPMNAVTSYLDASVVYGSNTQAADDLREHDNSGKLKSHLTQMGELLPPLAPKTSDVCPPITPALCFVAGDERVNEHAFLTSFHNLFLREHNRVADNLRMLNPRWTGDTIFHESRKIVGAELQCIVCKEFLPILVGTELMKLYHLCEENYDATVNPTALSEFATAAYRLHSMLSHKFSTSNPQTSLMRMFSNPEPMHQGYMGIMLKELSSVPAQANDRALITDVSDFLYKFQYESYGIDLPTINIQRGRDHGLAPYTAIVEKCSKGKYKITNFSDLNHLMPAENILLLQKYYKNVKDIDIFVGLIMERVKSGVSGPTANCIIAHQFQRLFSGDRFFYLNSGFPNSFKPTQLESIKTCSIARILCDNTDIREIASNPFLTPSNKNPIKQCDTISPVNLQPWKED